MRPLEDRPQALDAVGVDIAPDVLTKTVADRVVVEREPAVGAGLVGVDSGSRLGVLADEPLQGIRVC